MERQTLQRKKWIPLRHYFLMLNMLDGLKNATPEMLLHPLIVCILLALIGRRIGCARGHVCWILYMVIAKRKVDQ